MPLITLILILLVIGVFLYLINTYGSPYVDGKILNIINAVAVIAVIIYVLKVFGLWQYLGTITV